MRAGDLREKVELLRAAENEWGEPDPESDPIVIAKTRAEVIDKSGDNTQQSGADTKKKVITVVIRWRTDLQDDDFVRWFDDLYSISHIERNRAKRSITLTCESES